MRTHSIRWLTLFPGLALSLCIGEGLAAERVPVTSIKPLLVAAIDHGEAHGELVGEAATFMRERFSSTAAIEIDVKAIAALTDPACKRLEITTRQEAVIEAVKGPPTRKEFVYQLSYCRDGRLPDSK
jgi:hypothetical protein